MNNSRLILASAALAVALPCACLADSASQFDKLPALPATLAQAAGAVKITTGDNPALTAPSYDAAAAKLKKGLEDSSEASAQKQMDQGGMGVDVKRMQSDPAYAAAFQAKMRDMSPAERMAMSQRMGAAQRADAMNQVMAQRGAGGSPMAAMGASAPEERKVQAAVHAALDSALKASNARHAAVDREIDAAAKACPGDKTGWPLAACTAEAGKKGIAKHRAAETQALAEENAAYAKARALAKPRVDALAALLAKAKAAGGSGQASISAGIDLYTQMLLDFARASALRAGFWGGPVVTKYTGQETYLLKAGADRDVRWPVGAGND